MTTREDVLDCTLVTLHLVHHDGVPVEKSEHRQDRSVSEFHEKNFTVDLVE